MTFDEQEQFSPGFFSPLRNIIELWSPEALRLVAKSLGACSTVETRPQAAPHQFLAKFLKKDIVSCSVCQTLLLDAKPGISERANALAFISRSTGA